MAMAMEAITTGATANTMSTSEGLERRGLGLSQLFSYATLILLGSALLVLAMPRIAAYSIILPVQSRVAPYLTHGTSPPSDTLEKSIGAYVRAGEWLPGDASIQQTLARLYLRRAFDRQGTEEERRAALAAADQSIDRSLADAPNRHFDWALKAEILRLSGRPVQEIEGALVLSSYLGPYEASSMLLRSRIILDRWSDVSGAIHDIARKDLVLIWRTVPLRESLIALYLQESLQGRVLIRHIVLKSKEDIGIFNAMVRQAAQ